MRSENSLVAELRQEIVGYLKRERERASTASRVLENGSTAQIENSARLHQIGTILFIVGGIFRQLERTLAQDNQAEEDSQKGSKEDRTKG